MEPERFQKKRKVLKMPTSIVSLYFINFPFTVANSNVSSAENVFLEVSNYPVGDDDVRHKPAFMKLIDFKVASIFEPRREKNIFLHMPKQNADQLRGNHEADQRLCFRYIDSTIPLLPESEISSL